MSSNGVMVSDNSDPLRARARDYAKQVLSQSLMYRTMATSDQLAIYKDLVEEKLRDLKGEPRTQGVATAMATDSGEQMGYKGYDPGFGGDTKAFKDLVDSVDFPDFVKDLMMAVFTGNLRVMKEQTDAYIKLMKEATKSTADFIKKIGDDESFIKLAENKGQQYSVTTERQADGSEKIVLANPDGDKVDPDDATVKKDILEAKVMMAKEHRAALREVILMGVTRLVVEKGEIEAGVEFKVNAKRNSRAKHEDQNINVASLSAEFGGLFMPSVNFSMTNTNIQVNTSEKQAQDEMSALLKGRVNIKFKTDYFKLDNFANMYADGGVAALKPPGPAGTAPAAK
jgi:hypothetical protein